MSHFTEIKVDFLQKYERQLIEALEAQFGAGNVEVHEDGAPLYGYQGDNRSLLDRSSPDYAPPCHIIIRRNNVGSAANDVGYRRTGDGKYVAYISEFDKKRNFDVEKQNFVMQEYTARVAEKQLKSQGYSLKRVKEKDGTIKLYATKYS
jgi:D-alanine-D-alanine ligase-like ATP-grasp enzyme